MTQIKKETVQYLADLCRIAVTKEEQDFLITDLSRIVTYIEQLDEIDVKDVEPCNNVSTVITKTPLRSDTPQATLSHKDFIKNAPDQIAGLVRVPSVLKTNEDVI